MGVMIRREKGNCRQLIWRWWWWVVIIIVDLNNLLEKWLIRDKDKILMSIWIWDYYPMSVLTLHSTVDTHNHNHNNI